MASQVTFTNEDTHATPSSGKTTLYAKVNKKLYFKTDAGVEIEIGATTPVVTATVRNETGGTLLKGRAIAVDGYSTGAGCPLVDYADKDTPALRPAIAILQEDLNNNTTTTEALVVGVLTGVDTSSFSLTDQLVLGNNGVFSRPPPDEDPFTGEVQNLGSVSRSHATEGEVIVSIDGQLAVTASQIFALAGSYGTPSKTNRYVTETDPDIGPEFSDLTFRIYDSLSPTKKIAFEASGISAGQTRTITVPNYDFDLEQPVVDRVTFDTSYTPGSYPQGQVTWNATERTLDVATGYGPVLQVGQELYLIVYNDSGVQIDNGTVVYPNGLNGDVPTIGKAIANTHETLSGVLYVTTMDIADSAYGIVTIFGKIRDFDTSSWSPGTTLYLSPTTAGALTNTRPSFPNYPIEICAVLTQNATTGSVFVDVKGEPEDTVVNAWNGAFRESINFFVTSNGSTVTGSLSPSNGQDDLTMMFSDGFTMLDTSPPATVGLTPGTDTNPQTNYVYIPQSTKVLTVSTSDWPSGEHIRVAEILLKSAAATQAEGALRNQNWNDHVQGNDGQGHLLHMAQKLRKFPAQWDSGTAGSATVDATPTPDNVTIQVTAGSVFQMHPQSFPLFDMVQYTIDGVNQGAKQFTISGDGDLSATFPDGRIIHVNGSTGNDQIYTVASTSYSAPNFVITVEEAIPSAVVDGTIGDIVYIVNDNTTPYKTVTDLSSETTDADGDTLANKSFSFVLWGVINKSTQTSHIMINLPTGSYPKNDQDQAVADASNYTVYDIPDSFQGVGFLIARFTFDVDASGNIWNLYDTEDLRGKVPNTAAGGSAGGGSGVTTFLQLTDTPSAYSSQGTNVVRVNSGESALEFHALLHSDLGSVTANQHHNQQHAIDSTSDHSAASDNTNFNVSTTAHGLTPKLPNDATKFFNGVGSYVPVFPVHYYYADQLDFPINTDWAVNALAGSAADTNSAALSVRRFDDTTEQGVGFEEKPPTGATNIKIGMVSRAETAGGGDRTIGPKLYQRGIPNNAAVESWTSGYVMTDVTLPNNENWQYDEQTIALSTLGVTAGEVTQFELTRVNPTGGTELSGDWTLLLLEVTFT